jgi:hypothetical protein
MALLYYMTIRYDQLFSPAITHFSDRRLYNILQYILDD